MKVGRTGSGTSIIGNDAMRQRHMFFYMSLYEDMRKFGTISGDLLQSEDTSIW